MARIPAARLATLLVVSVVVSNALDARTVRAGDPPAPTPNPVMATAMAAETSPDPAEHPSMGAGARRRPEPDFDGDGRADLAIGAPFARSARRAAGEVHVLYGSASRPHLTRRQLIGQGRGGLKEKPEFGDLFGWSLAAGDFDGDGYSDLAIGSRFERVGKVKGAGAVIVVPGGERGLVTADSRLWTQGTRGVADGPERGDQFGWSIVAADFDDDGFDDLAIGCHMEDRGGSDSGVVHILYGTRRGLTARRSQSWHQDSPGVADHAEPHDQFGRSLAAADFDGDRFMDLAVGSPYEGAGPGRAGTVHVLHGSRRGLRGEGSQRWSQDSAGIHDRAEGRDQFGQSLAAGDIDRDGFGDLVVGVWFEDYRNPFSNEEGMHVIYGSRRGLDARGNEFWNKDSPGIQDRTAFSDEWGKVLTIADLDGDGFDDVAVGAPTSDVRAHVHANEGAISLIRGSRNGLTSRGNLLLVQGRAGVGDRAEVSDNFPSTLAAADVDGDGLTDLIAGTPWEHLGAADQGLVQVLHGPIRVGARVRETSVTVTRAGFGERPRKGVRFGWSLVGEAPHSGVPRVNDPAE